jgi:1-acyl-sn-glycerol-3-phosphate acyltransferase
MLPFLTRVCGAAVRVYYRFTAEGVAPRSGPVLFVANHPNSIVDAVVATAAAGRPIRFLAKAPLFEEQLMGWLVRAAGAIPVYRRQDDPALMERNATVFEAVHQALAAGDAVGIFPEGLSHSEPSLARLRTGAARISLGAANREEIRFPIVPIGIIHRQKERFRSDTLALVGPPVGWTDLAGRGEDDVEAVRELTRRIEAALRRRSTRPSSASRCPENGASIGCARPPRHSPGSDVRSPRGWSACRMTSRASGGRSTCWG